MANWDGFTIAEMRELQSALHSLNLTSNWLDGDVMTRLASSLDGALAERLQPVPDGSKTE